MGGTTHHVQDLSWPSDHVPIWASIAPPMQRVAHGEADVVIPRLAKWVVQHSNFQQHVEEQLVAVGGTTDDIHFDVKVLKGCMHIAAARVKGDIQEQHFKEPSVRLHVILKVWRLLREGCWPQLHRLVSRLPRLRDYYDVHTRPSTLHGHRRCVQEQHQARG